MPIKYMTNTFCIGVLLQLHCFFLGLKYLGRTQEEARKNLEIGLDGLLDDPEKGGKPIQAKLTEFTLKNVDRATFGDKADINIKAEVTKSGLTEEEEIKLRALIK